MIPRPGGPAGLAVLGAVQGATEWWPVSSSLHLRLARELLGGGRADADTQAVDVALHAGTALAATLALRGDLRRLLPAGVAVLRHRRARTDDERLAVAVALSVLPAALLGARGGPALQRHLGGDRPTAVLLAGAGLALAGADLRGDRRHRLPALPGRVTAAVALAQAAALAPGVSRSGATWTAARALGVRRPDAVRLSALMSLPVVAGALVRTGPRLRGTGVTPGALLVGAGAAAGVGHLALRASLLPESPRSSVAVAGYRVAVAGWLWHRATASARARGGST